MHFQKVDGESVKTSPYLLPKWEAGKIWTAPHRIGETTLSTLCKHNFLSQNRLKLSSKLFINTNFDSSACQPQHHNISARNINMKLTSDICHIHVAVVGLSHFWFNFQSDGIYSHNITRTNRTDALKSKYLHSFERDSALDMFLSCL